MYVKFFLNESHDFICTIQCTNTQCCGVTHNSLFLNLDNLGKHSTPLKNFFHFLHMFKVNWQRQTPFPGADKILASIKQEEKKEDKILQ